MDAPARLPRCPPTGAPRSSPPETLRPSRSRRRRSPAPEPLPLRGRFVVREPEFVARGRAQFGKWLASRAGLPPDPGPDMPQTGSGGDRLLGGVAQPVELLRRVGADADAPLPPVGGNVGGVGQ